MGAWIYRQETFTGSAQRWGWDDDIHQPFNSPLGGSFSPGFVFESPANTIVDVYQKTPTQVVLVTFNNTYAAADGTSYPKMYLNETVVVGTGGDSSTVLLYVNCNYDDSPKTMEFAVYSLVTKGVTVYSYPYPVDYLNSSPFDLSYYDVCKVYNVGTSTPIQSQCIGTTRRDTFYDGAGGVTVVDTPNSVLCGYVVPIPEIQATEVLRVKIDRTCYKNPVYLVWKNTLGGWDHWLFKNAQNLDLSTESIGAFVKSYTDLSIIENTIYSLGKEAQEVLTLGADNLTETELRGIKELLYSPMVYMLFEDRSKFSVQVKPGTYKLLDTRDTVHDIELQILLPAINTVKA